VTSVVSAAPFLLQFCVAIVPLLTSPALTASKFLMHYGFCVENNREPDGRSQNELGLTIPLRPFTDDALRQDKVPHTPRATVRKFSC
jgi:hypothetical protein